MSDNLEAAIGRELQGSTDWQAFFIKVFAVVSAVSRWVGALLEAEGFSVIETWETWWIPLSASMAAAMAIVEAVAFAYVFKAWKDTGNNKMLYIASVSAVVFIFVLSPYIAAQVRDVTLSEILSNEVALWGWSVSVAASTITIVAGVGYAEKRQMSVVEQLKELGMVETEATAFSTNGNSKYCWCGAEIADYDGYREHFNNYHWQEAQEIGDPYGVYKHFSEKYAGTMMQGTYGLPSVSEWIEMMRTEST